MGKNVKRNNYRIDTENNIAAFELRSTNGNIRYEFVVDLDDIDCAANIIYLLVSPLLNV